MNMPPKKPTGLPEKKENNLESKPKKTFRGFLDYINSLGKFDSAKKEEWANERWFDGLKNKSFKDGTLRLQTLDERYESGMKKYSTPEEFYIMHSGLETEEDKKLFWEMREELNQLVDQFNEELKKENTDTEVITKLYKEIEELIDGKVY